MLVLFSCPHCPKVTVSPGGLTSRGHKEAARGGVSAPHGRQDDFTHGSKKSTLFSKPLWAVTMWSSSSSSRSFLSLRQSFIVPYTWKLCGENTTFCLPINPDYITAPTAPAMWPLRRVTAKTHPPQWRRAFKRQVPSPSSTCSATESPRGLGSERVGRGQDTPQQTASSCSSDQLLTADGHI